MDDYSAHLIAARAALARAEAAANRHDYLAMQAEATEAARHVLSISRWANWAPEGVPFERKGKR